MTLPPLLSIIDLIADPVAPAKFPQTMLRWRNDRVAEELGLNTLGDEAWVAAMARFEPLPDNLPQPLALRYHGHQFGHYNPDLGDGRGFTFAQLRDSSGRWRDLGTKGSGQTPYSRFGDGRLTLKGAVRELLATEMLTALGVPTSQTLSIVETGEQLHRGDEPSPTRSAVLVRASHGHIRVGSFERLSHLGDAAGIERLARYALTTLYRLDPAEVSAMAPAQAAAALLTRTVAATARTVAAQMIAGFVHGVLNSDNINVTGESFDYGPWRFARAWDAAFTAAYFDHGGLYAFGRQPGAVHWAVGQLAVALRHISEAPPLVEALQGFAPAYETAFAQQLCWRLGVSTDTPERDRALVTAADAWLARNASAAVTDDPGGLSAIDRFFLDWAGGRTPPDAEGDLAAPLIAALAERTDLRGQWWSRAAPQGMLIAEVEALWAPIAERDDWTPLWAKVDAVRAMGANLAQPAPAPMVAAAP